MKWTEWGIAEDSLSPEQNLRFETLAVQGCPLFHLRGFPEDALVDKRFSRSELVFPALINGACAPDIPDFLRIELSVSGERLLAPHSSPEEYGRTFSFRNGYLTRSFTIRAANGATIQILVERFVSALTPYAVYQKITLTSDIETDALVTMGFFPRIPIHSPDLIESIEFARRDASSLATRITLKNNKSIRIVTNISAQTDTPTYDSDAAWATLTVPTRLVPGTPAVIEKRSIISLHDSREAPSDTEASDEVDSFDVALTKHSAAWESLRTSSNLIIDGDIVFQGGLRAYIYHMIRSGFSTPAQGVPDVTGFTDCAAVPVSTWENDIFLLPFYAHSDPELAHQLALFRIRTLDGARSLASRYGYGGARYAYASDSTGNEVSSLWPFTEHAVHVTADAILGMEYYSKATTNTMLWEREAAGAAVEAARYWMERIDLHKGDQLPNLLAVTGPDEFKPLANNDFFTNVVVAFTLNLASRYGHYAGALESERREFARCAEALPVLQRNDGLFLQCEGFDDFSEPETIPSADEISRAMHVTRERLFRSKHISQADVLLGMALFPWKFTVEDVHRAYEYYAPLTLHHTAYSFFVHSIIAARIGKSADAWHYWLQGTRTVLERASAGSLHLPSAGAAWMAVVFGFAGMSSPVGSQNLSFAPCLPEQISRLKFPLLWRGCPIEIDLRKRSLLLSNRGPEPLMVTVAGQEKTVHPATERRFDF